MVSVEAKKKSPSHQIGKASSGLGTFRFLMVLLAGKVFKKNFF